MTTSQKTYIEQQLKSTFEPNHLEVINESDAHNVAPGSETHFKVVVVSAQFDSLKAVKRHQAVYGALSDALASGVHALAIHAYTPSEWVSKSGGAPNSPNCMNSK